MYITFENYSNDYLDITEGPFEWVEMINGNMFALRPGEKEAEEIAGINADGTWDAGPFEDDGSGNRKRRNYNHWVVYTNKEMKDAVDHPGLDRDSKVS